MRHRSFWFVPQAFKTARVLLLSLAATVVTLEPALAALHRGDHVTIVVFEHPELTVDSTVGSDGAIGVPLLGRVRAEGTDPVVLAAAIKARLERYVIEPEVEVRLIDAEQYAFVTGVAGGTVALRPGLPLATALAQTKLDPSADLARVAILRDGRPLGNYDVDALRMSGEPGPILASGDIIEVPTKPVVVTVAGAVKTTGHFYLTATEPLADALEQAIPGEEANSEKIILERGGTMQVTTLGGPELAKPGQSGDRLTVPESQQIEVVGYVARPGLVALKTDSSLMSALFFAGGPTKDGDLRHVSIVHRTAPITHIDLRGLERGDLSQNPTLQEGDIVYVPEQHGFDFRILFDLLLFGSRFIHIR